MATQPPLGGIDLEHSNSNGNRGANDEIPSDGLTAHSRDSLGELASRGQSLEAQHGSETSISSAYFSPVRLDVWKSVIKHLTFFTKRNNKYCLTTKDGQGIIQKFDAIQDVLEFLLKHGIPMQTEPFSSDFENLLFRTIAETHVPKPELSNVLLKIPSNSEIIPIMQSLGFGFANSDGLTLHVFQKPQIKIFDRIYLPKSLEVAGESPPSSYGFRGVHYFETLEDVREYIRGSKRLEFVSGLSGRTRMRKPGNRYNDGSENKKWRENMLLLRIWGATSSRPLHTFDWSHWNDITSKHKAGEEGQARSSKKVSQSPVPKKKSKEGGPNKHFPKNNPLLGPTNVQQEHSAVTVAANAKSAPGLEAVAASTSTTLKVAVSRAPSNNAPHQDSAYASRPEKRSNTSENSSSTEVKRTKIGQPASSSSPTGNRAEQSTTKQRSIRQLEDQYKSLVREEKTLEILKLKEELGKHVGRKTQKSLRSLPVVERLSLIEKLEKEKEALSRQVKERNASGHRWLALKDKTMILLTGESAKTEVSLSFRGISLETMQAREKAAGEEYAKRKAQHEELLLKVESKKKNIERLKADSGKNM